MHIMLPGLLKGLRDLVYPKICLACKQKMPQAEGRDFICLSCQDKIKKNVPPFCATCGRRLNESSLSDNICPECSNNRLHFDRAFSPCVYTGVIKELIHEFKYKNKDYLSKPLSAMMNDFINEFAFPMDDLDLIIPIPLHNLRLREREFNQAQLLALDIAKKFNKKVSLDVLVRHRQTKTQTGLSPELRFSNVRESFGVHNPQIIENKNVLLIDDVLTTGATASEAALALKNAGANLVLVMSLAS